MRNFTELTGEEDMVAVLNTVGNSKEFSEVAAVLDLLTSIQKKYPLILIHN